jgi:hypothetical protein
LQTGVVVLDSRSSHPYRALNGEGRAGISRGDLLLPSLPEHSSLGIEFGAGVRQRGRAREVAITSQSPD